jgi:hypothetical protein
MLARPRCEVCTNCKYNRRGGKRSRQKICMYQLENLTQIDLKDPVLKRMLRKDQEALAVSWSELRSMWKAPPTHIAHPRIVRMTALASEGADPNRATSLQSALIAQQHRAATTIATKYRTHYLREKFRKWVRLAMNTDAGRSKCATIIGSKFWRRTKCMQDYHYIQRAIVSLQKFYRIVHARKIVMKKALIKLKQCVQNILGQEWQLHRIVHAVENSGRKKDCARIHLATHYLVHQGHAQGMSVPGILRLCKQLEQTKKRVKSKKRKLLKQWKKQGKPKSWDNTNATSLQVSRWYNRQRRSRERRRIEEETAFHKSRRQILEIRRIEKEKWREEEVGK